MRLWIDAREPPTIINQIKHLGEFEIKALPAGDIWLEAVDGWVIVERKEPLDLLASIADGRLFNQCLEMRLESDWAYILITGPLDYTVQGKVLGTGWDIRAVWGALLTVQELGVSVVFGFDLPADLLWLAGRKRTKHIIQPRLEALPMPDDQRVLASLPGIGPSRAGELLAERNLRDALLCLLDPGCAVKGIGPKTKENVRQLFGLAPGDKITRQKGENHD